MESLVTAKEALEATRLGAHSIASSTVTAICYDIQKEAAKGNSYFDTVTLLKQTSEVREAVISELKRLGYHVHFQEVDYEPGDMGYHQWHRIDWSPQKPKSSWWSRHGRK